MRFFNSDDAARGHLGTKIRRPENLKFQLHAVLLSLFPAVFFFALLIYVLGVQGDYFGVEVFLSNASCWVFSPSLYATLTPRSLCPSNCCISFAVASLSLSLPAGCILPHARNGSEGPSPQDSGPCRHNPGCGGDGGAYTSAGLCDSDQGLSSTADMKLFFLWLCGPSSSMF